MPHKNARYTVTFNTNGRPPKMITAAYMTALPEMPGFLIFAGNDNLMVAAVPIADVATIDRQPLPETDRPAGPPPVTRIRVHHGSLSGRTTRVEVEFTDGTRHEYRATTSTRVIGGPTEEVHLYDAPIILPASA